MKQPPDEKWVPVGLRHDEARELGCASDLLVEGLGDEPRHVVLPNRAQTHLVDGSSILAHGVERPRERVSRVDLRIAVGAQEQQVAIVRIARPQFDEPERGRVGPLQIVQEEHERVLWPGDHAQEGREYEVEAILRLLGSELRSRRLRAEDSLELGNDVDENLAAGRDGSLDVFAPSVERGLRLRQEATHEHAKRLNERRIRHAALELVELSEEENAPARDDRPLELSHERRLSDSRRTNHENEFARAHAGSLASVQQDAHVGGAPVELVGDVQGLRDVVRSERERDERPRARPLLRCSLQVDEKSFRGLVAAFRLFHYKRQYDSREHPRKGRVTLVRSLWPFRQMGVNDLDRILRLERRDSRE